jgi:predicted phage terminase large subunit-like protein
MTSEELAKIKLTLHLIKRKEFAQFTKFRKYYFPHYNKLKDSNFHEDISAILEDITKSRAGKLAIAAPRGSAKSTVITLQYVIFCLCYKVEKFIVIISNTSDQAQGFLASIKQELETNSLLAKDFPEVCELGTKPAPARWTQKEVITKNGIKVLALGVGQQIRGRRNKENRPSLIILDDVEKDDSVQNPESYYKIQDWLEKSVLKSGTPETNIIFTGTIHHYESLLAKYTSPNLYPGWKKKIYRSILNWAENIGLWEKWRNIYNHKEEYEGSTGVVSAKTFFEANQEEMLKGTRVLWSEQKSYYDLMVQREDEGSLSFDSEMQNEPVNPRDCLFNMDDIHYWDDRFETDSELLEHLKNKQHSLRMFGACDPSLGKQNKRGDYSAVICTVYDSTDKTCYIIDADLDKRPPDKTIDCILALHNRRNFECFGFESNGFQSYLADEIKKQATKAGLPLPIEKIINTSDKRSRIDSLQPMIKNGVIQFSKKHRILLEQLKLYPKSGHDDGLDALQMIWSLCVKNSSGVWTEESLEALERVMLELRGGYTTTLC